jgi:hypothetical protein
VYLLEYRLLRWRLSGKEVDGDRIWKNLRRFSGWTCAGSVAGVATFATMMHGTNLKYNAFVSGITRRRYYELQAEANRYILCIDFLYPVCLLCVIYSLNMLLRRVSDHASHSYYNTARDHDLSRRSTRQGFDWRDCVGQYALYYCVRSLNVFATLLCVLHAVSRFVAGAFSADRSRMWDQAAALTDAAGADTEASRRMYDSNDGSKFHPAFAVALFFEAVILVVMAAAFVLFFPACIIMFRRVERRLLNVLREMHLRSDQGSAFLPFEFSPPAPDGSKTQVELPIVEARQFLQAIKSSAAAQRRRFLFCLALVTSALVVLAAQAVGGIVVASQVQQHQDTSCLDPCGPCQSTWTLVLNWIIHTPELLPLVYSLCSTLPLLFSFWLMTTEEDRKLLLNPSSFLTEEIMLRPAAAESESEARLRAERIRMGINLK